jgi:antitoxin (DNA-binding transcriptional repressor) of toxin-antitoxin stability system
MPTAQTMNASEFKAKCLNILDHLADHTLDQVVITKRGRVVAILTPPPSNAAAVRQLHGAMRGSVVMPPDLDLTAPIGDEAFAAAQGELHG